MQEDVIGSFVAAKKADSTFVSLEDRESCRVLKLTDIKRVTKAGFGGEEKEVLRLVCQVETINGPKMQNFDNGTQRFAKELVDNKIKIGDSFTIRREGLQTKTRYLISDVVRAAEMAASTPKDNAPASTAPVDTAGEFTPPAA